MGVLLKIHAKIAPLSKGCTKTHPLLVLDNDNMNKDCGKFFTHPAPPEPPDDLFDKIARRIREEERRTFKRRLTIFSIALALSAAAFIPAFRAVETELAESGFVEFSSLLFSDSGAVLAYWQSFVFALLESLPTTGLIALLAAVFALLQSLKFFSRDVKFIFKPATN